MLNRRAFTAGASAAALGAVASPYVQRAGAAEAPIKVGVINSMSGSYAAYAQEGDPAFRYVIDKINQSGGIKSLGGAKIELIFADDTSQPARCATEVRRLVTEEKVDLLTGSMLSSQMLAISPVLDELQTPCLSVWAGGSKSNWLYTLGYDYDRGYAKTMADFAIWLRDKNGFAIKTWSPCYSNYEAGQQVNKHLLKRMGDAGFKTLEEAPLDTKAQDQTAAMIRIRSAKPDLVLGLVTPRDGLLLHQARYNLNYHGSIFAGGTGGYSDLSLWRDLSPDIAKAVLTRNLFAMTGFSPSAKMPSMQAIVTELRDQAKVQRIGQAAIQSAQAARVLQRAIEAAGSRDKKALLDGFKKVDIKFGDPDLYVAKPNGVKFADDRLLEDGSAFFVQWMEDQSQQVLFPEQFANAPPRPRA
ncbi:MAG: ABC transporter substrate-binding protein [Rhodoblastus sp.]|jgi:ABC-type branched-subunit amino acid transport system substrate-binding protein